MRFIQSILAGAALVAAAFAEVKINEYPKEVQAGRTYKVTYSPADNTPTTFILRKGDNANLDTITTLTESATGGEFQWSVDSALPNANDYALEIRQGTDVNYIGPITLTGGSKATSSASKASSTHASTSSAPSTLTTSTSVATVSSTVSGNATVTSASLSHSSTVKPSTTPTQTLRAPDQPGAASAFGSSPMAVLFGAVAAMVYLN
ncbi:uncharacterized protein EI97DRAFT_466378 [Westerdykella ornata]|uniref:Yeast cell wall synthesis Kre9/Knh1-like N-terminal domain-containing protein n=1 Tax=Westerdykella ornata TaxID=318751 RepID=A0A6A6JNS0_WESOR|nr:uncharacterized protein EI97DRAFT_466378 [Westerdykella ornata]KAF2277538.1 hypothetical protein EI97DRAFT_466378 [Westerdykella ornata]